MQSWKDRKPWQTSKKCGKMLNLESGAQREENISGQEGRTTIGRGDRAVTAWRTCASYRSKCKGWGGKLYMAGRHNYRTALNAQLKLGSRTGPRARNKCTQAEGLQNPYTWSKKRSKKKWEKADVTETFPILSQNNGSSHKPENNHWEAACKQQRPWTHNKSQEWEVLWSCLHHSIQPIYEGSRKQETWRPSAVGWEELAPLSSPATGVEFQGNSTFWDQFAYRQGKSASPPRPDAH